jgi:hypothetical protein
MRICYGIRIQLYRYRRVRPWFALLSLTPASQDRSQAKGKSPTAETTTLTVRDRI